MDFTQLVRVASERFGAACRAADPSRTVPSCPEWTTADLRWHLTAVQDFWGSIVTDRPTPPDAVIRVGEPTDAEADAVFAERSRRLTEALAAADPYDACWSWDEQGGGTVAWVRRRMAHEAIVHRVDAEQAAGWPVDPIDVDVAADGVDEALDVHLTGVPAWATFHPGGGTVELVDTDSGRHWGIELGRMTGTSLASGQSYDLSAAELRPDLRRPSSVVAGRGVDLYLWLWGRVDASRLHVEGDRALVGAVRAYAADAM